MCGIVVTFHKYEAPNVYDHDMSVMLDAMKHRGTDQVCINHHGNCVVGFRRLAITEREMEQPSRKTEWVVYLNGEIYNYKELGFSGSECDVVSQGLQMFGSDFVRCLNGMFFIVAIKGDEVYIFRDRYGIKPVYYWQTDDHVVIASEAQAIAAHSGYNFRVNQSAMRQWHVFNNVLCDQTLFNGILKMPKSTCWELKSNMAKSFWRWEFTPDEDMDYDFAVRRVRELVQQAVRRQIPQEVPYAVCVSGGVDSNIISSQLPPEIIGYTADFFQSDVSEINMAKRSGRRIKADVSFCVRNFDATVKALDDLRVGQSWAHYSLFKYIKSDGVKVVFDGAGADELFGGYEWRYREPDYYNVVNRTGVNDPLCKSIFESRYLHDSLDARYRFDAEHFLEGVLLVVDKLSMAHTLEVRVPFLDNDLVDFALTIPPKYKYSKQVLKDAFRGIVADEILDGPKRGFQTPDWLKGEGNAAHKWATQAFESWLKQYGPK